jgi:hypothetical protein
MISGSNVITFRQGLCHEQTVAWIMMNLGKTRRSEDVI